MLLLNYPLRYINVTREGAAQGQNGGGGRDDENDHKRQSREGGRKGWAPSDSLSLLSDTLRRDKNWSTLR